MFVLIFALVVVLPPMFLIILGAAHQAEGAVCGVGCILVYLLPVLAIPFALFLGRYDSAKTWEHLRFNLGSLGEVEKLVDEIDSELADPGNVEVFGIRPSRFRAQTNGTIFLTQSWILWFGAKEFRFLPLTHVLWFYKRIEIPSAWWDIRDRRRFQLACVTRSNELLMLHTLDEECVDDAMETLIRKRPEAVFGFSAKFVDMAENSITPILQEVNRRRAEYEKASTEERAEWRNDCSANARFLVRRVDEAVAQSAPDY